MAVPAPMGDALAGEVLKSGPLRVSASNARYFADGAGRTIYLTGSHTWDNFQDWGGETPAFNYEAYLNDLKANNHNFIRLWKVGESTVKGDGIINPMPWKRTGPGSANDGQPRFNLTQFDDAYFDRLRTRVIEAGIRGIYVSIMLFDGIYDWKTHPFNPANNMNGADGGDEDFFTMSRPTVNRLQKDYVRKVVDSVNDLDNILYEVGNEIKRHSLEWQCHFINFIHDYEKTKPNQHPVGMTTSGGDGDNDIANHELFHGPAEWISPRSWEPGQNYSFNPPPATGQKVIISDTDHLWGVLGEPTAEWVWKSFMRGMNPILMDVIQNRAPGTEENWNNPHRPGLVEARAAMGQTLKYASRVNLEKMLPMVELVSTKYCLAEPGKEYLAYLPVGDIRKRERLLQKLRLSDRKISIDLFGVNRRFRSEWHNLRTDEVVSGEIVYGGSLQFLKVPFDDSALLHLWSE